MADTINPPVSWWRRYLRLPRNVLALVRLFIAKDGALQTDFEDEVLAGCLLTHHREVRHAQTLAAMQSATTGVTS